MNPHAIPLEGERYDNARDEGLDVGHDGPHVASRKVIDIRIHITPHSIGTKVGG